MLESETEYESAKKSIIRIAATTNNPYNDGYVQFESKKNLYRLKYWLDLKLRQSPEFSGEKEWLEELEKSKVWEILKE